MAPSKSKILQLPKASFMAVQSIPAVEIDKAIGIERVCDLVQFLAVADRIARLVVHSGPDRLFIAGRDFVANCESFKISRLKRESVGNPRCIFCRNAELGGGF